MKPHDINSGGNTVVSILYNDGHDGFSVARLRDADGDYRIGCRWNGKANELGFPNSRGHATWMLLPDDFGDAICVYLAGVQMRAGANNMDDQAKG